MGIKLNLTKNGIWNAAASWVGGVVPGAGNDAILTTTTPVTVTDNVPSTTVNSLSITTNTLVLTTGTTLTANGTTPTVHSVLNGATIDGPGTLSTIKIVDIQGNTAHFGGGVTWINTGTVNASGAIQIGDASGAAATIDNKAGGVFNLTKTGLTTPALFNTTPTNGAGVFRNESGATVNVTSTANTTVVAIQFINNGTVTISSGAGHALAADATLEIDGVGNILNNGGIIGGADATHLSGVLRFNGGSTTIQDTAGLFTDDIVQAGGALTLSDVALDTYKGTFIISGGTTTLSGSNNKTASNCTFQMTGGDLFLNGTAMTLGGTDVFTGGRVFGMTSQALTTSATASVTLSGPLGLGDGLNWVNQGTINNTGTLTGGIQSSASTSASASVNNSGTIKFSDDVGSIKTAAGGTFQITNGGTISKTAGVGISHVAANLISTGTLSAAANGTLQLEGASNDISGTLSGAGTVSFGLAVGAAPGSSQTNLRDAITTTGLGALLINGSNVSLYHTGAGAIALSLAVPTDFEMLSGKLSLNGGALTLAGHGNLLGGGTINGGTAAASGTITTVAGSSTQIGGSTAATPGVFTGLGGAATLTNLAWTNAGTVNAWNQLILGDSAGGGASVTNTGTFNFLNDSAGIYLTKLSAVPVNPIGNAGYSVGNFTNSGTLAKTGGIQKNVIQANFTDTGTVNSGVATGTIEFDGNANSFTNDIFKGSGTIAFGAGLAAHLQKQTVISGTDVSAFTGTFLVNGGTVQLQTAGLNLAKGTFAISSGRMDINGQGLTALNATLSGGVIDGTGLPGDVFLTPDKGVATVTGSSTAATPFSIGGGTIWHVSNLTGLNPGKVLVNGVVAMGSSIDPNATINNDGVFQMGAGASISTAASLVGGTPWGATDVFNNTNQGKLAGVYTYGTLTTVANAGVVHIYASVNSSGTVNALAGSTIEFDGLKNVFTGTDLNSQLNGKTSGSALGTISFGGGFSYLDSATIVGAPALTVNGGDLVMSSSVAYNYTGILSVLSGALHLNNNVYTLSATSLFSGGTIDGTAPGAPNKGTGTLLFSGTAVESVGTLGVTLAGVNWDNNGNLNILGQMTAVGGSATTISNEAGATITFGANNAGIYEAAGGSAALVNLGTISVTTGFSAVDNADTTNGSAVASGTINIAKNSTLTFGGNNDFTHGSLDGAGTATFAAGLTLLAPWGATAGSGITSVANLTVTGNAVVQLADSTGPIPPFTYIYSTAGSYKQTGGELDIQGDKLVLTAPSLLAGVIDGGGEMDTSGAVMVGAALTAKSAATLTVAGGLDWKNSGAVTDTIAILVGDDSGPYATIENLSGASFTLAADSPSFFKWSGTSTSQNVGNLTFVNAGTFVKSGTGYSTLWSDFINTGKIEIAKGSAVFMGDIDGTGPGIIQIDGGTTAAPTMARFNGAVQNNQTIVLSGAKGTVAVVAIGDYAEFGAKIQGFIAGDMIDFTNFVLSSKATPAVTEKISGTLDTVTVSTATGSVSVNLVGLPAVHAFHAVPDAGGGVMLTMT